MASTSIGPFESSQAYQGLSTKASSSTEFDQLALEVAAKVGLANGLFEDAEEKFASAYEEFLVRSGSETPLAAK